MRKNERRNAVYMGFIDLEKVYMGFTYLEEAYDKVNIEAFRKLLRIYDRK